MSAIAQLSLLLLLGVVGCVTPGSKQSLDGRQSLASAPICCAHLNASRIKPLPKTSASVELSASSQAFAFEDGKAYFEVFELPAFKDTYSVTITAHPVGTESDLAVLMPRLAFYDGDFRRTRYFDERDVKQRGRALERTVFINPADRSEKYLIVSGSSVASTRQQQTSVIRTTPIFAGPFIFHYHSGAELTTQVHNSPTGTFVLETKGLQP